MQKQRKNKTARRSKATAGRDDMVSNNSRKDYFVANALEITPHPNQHLRAVLGQPVMDRRFKYSIFETTAFSASSATSATPLSMITISQGTTDITRTGDRIRAKRLWFTGKVIGNAAQTGITAGRVVVVCWNPVGNAAVNAPIASQVIQHSATYGPYGSYSRDFGDSYQIIYDAVFSVTPASTTSEAELIHFDRSLTIDMEFVAGATTPAVNNFYIFFLSDAAANQASMQFSATTWYEDLDA